MGAQLATWQLVEAPVTTPLPFGLFSVAEPRLPVDEHWRSGVQWLTQACAPTGTTTGPCIDLTPPILTAGQLCSILKYDPFTVYSYNTDEIIGFTLAEHLEQTKQRLINGEQYGAESYLWTAIAATAVITDLSWSALDVALGYVEYELAQAYFGQGVIHMNRITAIALGQHLRVAGGRLTTLLGTPVIAGGGYDSANVSPSTGGHIYGTGPVVLYRGDIDTRETAVDKSTNQASIIAQRDYVVGWDCSAVGAKINYPDSAVIS